MPKTKLRIGHQENVGGATIKRDAKGYTVEFADGHTVRRHTYKAARVTAEEGRYANSPAPAPSKRTNGWEVWYRADGGEPRKFGGMFDVRENAKSTIIETINLICGGSAVTLGGFSDDTIAFEVRGVLYEFEIVTV